MHQMSSSLENARICCLFAPLNYCYGETVTNGFCEYHLRAVFNLAVVQETQYIYHDKRLALSCKKVALVADPQPFDNMYTSVFPLFELFENVPSPVDVKLHHFGKFLRETQTDNWKSIYTRHVNFLTKSRSTCVTELGASTYK